MNKKSPWHEDDGFWETFAPFMFTAKRWEAVPEEVDQILGLLDVDPPATICDLACGPGRHSLELARRGCWVTSVDRTSRYLSEAGEKAAADGLSIEFVEADMREFVRPEAFDSVVNLFTAFGYFEDRDDDRRVLANVFESLKPGGRLLIDVIGKEILARVFRPRDWQEEDGAICLDERRVTNNWSWIANRWIWIKGAERREFELGHRVYSAQELTDLLTECGFADVTVFGDLAGAEYDHNAKRLVAVARK